jgi:uncharacterized membrane protein
MEQQSNYNMSRQAVSYVELNSSLELINSALESISSDIGGIYSELEAIDLKQDQLESELTKLADAFAAFVEADSKHKTLQLAEIRIGNLRQELQVKFGYYGEVRRMAVGILQGVDTGVVSNDTLKCITEEVMIKAPGYWLAPVLVALAAWMRNDKSITEKALNEALKRDDYKTTLFFMLVMRRLARNEASMKWLERYFIHQDPKSLDREFVVVLEAVATGIFLPAARQLMMRNVKSWLNQLTQSDVLINNQKFRWVKFFEELKPLSSDVNDKYPLLKKFSPNWKDLKKSLEEAKKHDAINSYFKDIISSSPADFSKNVKVQLDEILSSLVINFDDEELPLQEQIRFNQLVIQMDGDKTAAQAKMDAEKSIFEKKVDFLELLNNACFNPELLGATRAIKALAVSISQPWIIEAYDTFTAQARSRIPRAVELEIDGFDTYTRDGSDENELLESQEAFYQDVLETELNKLSFPYVGVIIGALICLLGFWAFNLHIIAGIVGLGIGGVLTLNTVNNYNRAKRLQKKY